jgi:hypothetical protein
VEYNASDSLEIYLDFTGTSGDTYDIAWQEGDIWLALDSASQPVRRYDTAGTVVDFLPGSLIPQATGLTMDPEGYLWVSDNDGDLIYRVDLGTALYRSTWAEVKDSF